MKSRMLRAQNSNFYIIYMKCFGCISDIKYIAKINYCFLLSTEAIRKCKIIYVNLIVFVPDRKAVNTLYIYIYSSCLCVLRVFAQNEDLDFGSSHIK